MICKRCNKKIKETDKAVLWKTFKGKKVLEEVYWHFKCFIEWRNESLENRAMKLYKNSMMGALQKFNKMFNKNNNEETKDKILQIGVE